QTRGDLVPHDVRLRIAMEQQQGWPIAPLHEIDRGAAGPDLPWLKALKHGTLLVLGFFNGFCSAMCVAYTVFPKSVKEVIQKEARLCSHAPILIMLASIRTTWKPRCSFTVVCWACG